jgi:hypothetical protein
MKPEEDLDGGVQERHDEITAPDVCDFMSDHSLQFIVVQPIGNALRQQQRHPPEAENTGLDLGERRDESNAPSHCVAAAHALEDVVFTAGPHRYGPARVG